MTSVSFDGRPQQLRPGEGRVAAVARARRAPHADRLGRDRATWRAHAAVAGRSPVAGQQHRHARDAAGFALDPRRLGSGRRARGALLGRTRGVHRAWRGCSAAGRGRRCASPNGCCSGSDLSTQSWFVFSLTAAWLVAMRWREGLAAGAANCRAGASTPCRSCSRVHRSSTILTLVFSGIRNGLLARARHAHRRRRQPVRRLQLVPGSDRRRHRRPEHPLGADVGVSLPVLRVGELDGVRAGALAALGVQRVEVERTLALRKWGHSPFPGNGAGADAETPATTRKESGTRRADRGRTFEARGSRASGSRDFLTRRVLRGSPGRAGDRRLRASSRALGSSTISSSGPLTRMCRTLGSCSALRASLFSTVKPREILSLLKRRCSMELARYLPKRAYRK